MKAKTKAKARRALIWLGTLGPLALLIADRVGHLFGICLGV